MKTKLNRTKNLILVLILLTGATQSYAQRGRNMSNCCQNIPNLTENQKTQIEALQSNHFEKIAELRQERRAKTSTSNKAGIRKKMLQERQEHREEIGKLLTEDQKAYYEKNYRNMRNNDARRNANRGKGNGKKGRQSSGSQRNW